MYVARVILQVTIIYNIIIMKRVLNKDTFTWGGSQ